MKSKKDSQKPRAQPQRSPQANKTTLPSKKQDFNRSSRKEKTLPNSIISADTDREDQTAHGQPAGHYSESRDADAEGERPKSEPLSADQKFIKVFFKGLRSKTTKETVYEVLSAFGPVRYLRMPFNNSLKKNLGYGFVIYSENPTGRYLLREVRKLSVDGKEVLLLDYLTNSH